jgi:hypothetical protein
MESLIYDSGASIQKLLDRGFEMPIHFAAMGTDGSLVAGTFQLSPEGQGLDCRITVQGSKPAGMTAPVNIMYVDRKGEAALVVLRPPQSEPAPTHPIV